MLAESKTFTLRNEIKWQGASITSLTLQPPKAGQVRQANGHLRTAQTPPFMQAMIIQLVAACAGTSEAVVDQIDQDDLNDCWEYVASFLANGRQTGSK